MRSCAVWPSLSHTQVTLNESSAIVSHLWSHYGANVTHRPWSDRLLSSPHLPTVVAFALLAAPSGLRAWPSAGLMMLAPPDEAVASSSSAAEDSSHRPLVLHGNEADEGSRAVRERLCVSQLAYVHVPTVSGGTRPIPHLQDPNTGFTAFGSARALTYLQSTYGEGREALGWTAPVPDPNLGDRDRTSWLTRLLKVVPATLGG